MAWEKRESPPWTWPIPEVFSHRTLMRCKAAFPGGLFFADGQAFVFDFIPKLFTLDTATGTDSYTGITLTVFGAIHGAAVPPPVGPAAVPEPGGFILLLVALGVPAVRSFLRRRRK
jgi:hypothetical protein